MTILNGDVKLVSSTTMDDVAEGGGAPSSNVVVDGMSNAIFPDVSELDRAAGRVNLRKMFVSVQTDTRDTYLGSNVIVAEPPSDPNVSVTLFTTGDTFDKRADAKSRLEAYLFVGTAHPSFLFGNHITGQRTILLFQRTAELPEVGAALVFRKREGFSDQAEQYVRVTAASAVERTYTDDQGDFKRFIVTLSISDALRIDLPGFDVSRYDPTGVTLASKTSVKDVIVADAARYYGCVPLTDAVNLGDLQAKGSSIYTRLLPSAQVETPISDARANQTTSALVATGGELTGDLTLVFTTSQNLYVGGGILPGSFSISRAGITLTDKGGALIDTSLNQVGTIDYDNGVLTLQSNVFGTGGGTHTLKYTPATGPQMVQQSIGVPVTIASRALSYTFTILPAPARASLNISFRAGGRWYMLREDGTGAIRGSDISFGAGTLNFSTGTVAVTLGAMPDTGTSIIIQWCEQSLTLASTDLTLENNGKVFFEIDTTGLNHVAGAMAINWGDGLTVHDDGKGHLSGDGTGTINYTTGVIRVSPNTLPEAGTMVQVVCTSNAARQTVTRYFEQAGGNWKFTLPENLLPSSVSLRVNVQVARGYPLGSTEPLPAMWTALTDVPVTIYEQDGVLYLNSNTASSVVGSVNHATGEVLLNRQPVASFVHQAYNYDAQSYSGWTTTSEPIHLTFNTLVDAVLSFATSSATPQNSFTSTIDKVFIKANIANAFTLSGIRFNQAGKSFVVKSTGEVQRDLNPYTGVGTTVGSMSLTTGLLTLDNWTVGSAPAVSNWRGIQGPPITGPFNPFRTGAVTFRTATSPIRSGSFTVLGTLVDGTTFNVSANTSGQINSDRVKGRINYEFGIVELYFCALTAPAGAQTVDLSFLGIPGVGVVFADFADKATIRYNAVAYSYLPLDADIIGIDPVRLPSDGRVPIFRAGGFAVIGNTAKMAPANVSNGQTLNTARVRLSRVRVLGSDSKVITSGYTTDLEAGTVTFTDIGGMAQPVTVEHRIEDLLTVRDAQIDGTLSFTRPVTHDYPVNGTYISSALVGGDLKSRVSVTFAQSTWDSATWSDTIVGNASVAKYNDVLAPIVVTNAGAVTERWVIQFTNNTAFRVIGEHVGVIAEGNTSTDIAPVNPATGKPYFSLKAIGWGTGWSAGNVLRINTIGAMLPVWAVRTVQQGPETGINYSFSLLVRGDVDRP